MLRYHRIMGTREVRSRVPKQTITAQCSTKLTAEAAEGEFQRALATQEAGKPAEARAALLRVLEADPGHLTACEALIALDDTTRAHALSEAERLAGEMRFAEALRYLAYISGAGPQSPLSERFSRLE